MAIIAALAIFAAETKADSQIPWDSIHPDAYSDYDFGYVEAVDCGSQGTGYRYNEGRNTVIINGYLVAEKKCGNFSIPQYFYSKVFTTDLGRWRNKRATYLNR